MIYLWCKRRRNCITSSAGRSAAVMQMFVHPQNVFACLCVFSTLQCVCSSLSSCMCTCAFVCVSLWGRERAILRYLASLLPLFVWLQAFRLSVRGLCSETKHAVISVTSLAAGTQHIHLSETRCYGAASNSSHFGSRNWHLGPQSLWGYWRAMKHSSVWVYL